LLLAGCGDQSKPATESAAATLALAKKDSVGPAPPAPDSQSGGKKKATTTDGGAARSDSVKGRPAPDSAELLVVATRIKGRTRRDSISLANTIRRGLRAPGWPVRGPQPLAGSLLPQKRIIAFYGNPLSKRMGILGELPKDEMLA
jgi:hypothetical protein